jgi:hypothetical protein
MPAARLLPEAKAMTLITRRTLFGIIAAPALVKVTSIMPVKALPADFSDAIREMVPTHTPLWRYFKYAQSQAFVGALNFDEDTVRVPLISTHYGTPVHYSTLVETTADDPEWVVETGAEWVVETRDGETIFYAEPAGTRLEIDAYRAYHGIIET